LPIAIRFQNAEQVTDNLFLPVQQFEFLSCPGAFGVAEAFNKRNSIISRLFVILGILRIKRVGLNLATVLTSKQKRPAKKQVCTIYFNALMGLFFNRDSIPIVTMLPYKFKDCKPLNIQKKR